MHPAHKHTCGFHNILDRFGEVLIDVVDRWSHHEILAVEVSLHIAQRWTIFGLQQCEECGHAGDNTFRNGVEDALLPVVIVPRQRRGHACVGASYNLFHLAISHDGGFGSSRGAQGGTVPGIFVIALRVNIVEQVFPWVFLFS